MRQIPGLSQRPLVMGIVNMTPDSFSGDGLLQDENPLSRALSQAEAMLHAGADLLDIGGESTRPGSAPVGVEEEIRRVVPLIEALAKRFPQIPLSVDTMKTPVAKAAFEAGASILNDVTGEAQDDAYFEFAAHAGAFLVLMHNSARAEQVEQEKTIGGEYKPPEAPAGAKAVFSSLQRLQTRALGLGVPLEKIVLDPGIGFGKTLEDNLSLVREIPTFLTLGSPVLIGASRKSFIGRLLDVPSEERGTGSLAVASVAAFLGASILRVHDVAPTVQAVRVAAALRYGVTQQKAV